MFHDGLVENLDENTNFRMAFESPTAMENQYILSEMGDLSGKTILDIGCGDGNSSLYFASKGAKVSCCDVSPKMVEFVQRRFEQESRQYRQYKNFTVEASVCAAENLSFPDSAFDFVYAFGVLHHVADRGLAYKEIARVLRPGGKFFAVEPLKGNPAIWIYRLMATKMRSDDEAPLTIGELARMKGSFDNCRTKSFWLATQLLFIKYYLVDHIHPNDAPYWKKIHKETEQTLKWWMPLKWIDRILASLPLLKRWAYCMVMSGQKPKGYNI